MTRLTRQDFEARERIARRMKQHLYATTPTFGMPDGPDREARLWMHKKLLALESDANTHASLRKMEEDNTP